MTISTWRHKDLLDTKDLSPSEILYLLDTAAQFEEINTRPVKKVPTLRGKGVILFFAEPSTRTKTSFDIAGKRLSADTFSLTTTGSSLSKGESLKDTALTLEAMNPDIIVIRHSSSGAAAFLAQRLACSIINAGDGWNAHPTQALLDAYTLRKYWQGEMRGKSLAILGDIMHSRVARSNIHLLTKLGVTVRLFGPRTLLPRGVHHWPVTIYHTMNDAVKDVDAIMCLRLQLERQQAGLLPALSEYGARFCLLQKHLDLAAPGAPILHPGPINRGLEISSVLADAPASRILDQVTAGVAVRMALLLTFAMRNETGGVPHVHN